MLKIVVLHNITIFVYIGIEIFLTIKLKNSKLDIRMIIISWKGNEVWDLI